MAISAGSALVSTLGAGVTFTGGAIGFSAAALIGQSFVTHFLVSTAIGAAINALTPKPTTPGAAGYTVTARGANLDHQIIYGKTRVAGAVVADFLSGEGGSEGTRFLHRVQVMAGHEVESYEEVYVNSYKVTEWKANTSAGGVGAVTGITDLTPWYNDPDAVLVPTKLVEVAPDGTETEVTDIDYSKWNALAMQFWTGADDQTASTRLIGEHPDNKWTSDHRLRGRAYMYIRMGRDADGDNFPTGVPEITAVIKGRKVYDPREVSHDPDDKSTWAWSDNPALCIRDYLTQDFGLGEKDIQVDDDLVETAANVCDQTADDGSTRYTCNGAFTTGIQPYDLLNSILTSMGGLLWYAQGQWRMKPAYWTAPTESFNEDDFRSAISVSTRHSRKDNFNTVEGTFRGPKSNYALTTFPAVDSAASITADGGTVSKIDLEMPFTDTPEEARRIARIVLERNRQQLTVRASFGLKAFRVQVGDVINLSLERFGWVNKTFEVTEWSFGNVDQYDIQIELTLREITENVFDEVDDGAVFELDNANVPSPLAGLAVTNLTATPSGFLGSDGTFIGNILVEWDAIVNSNVAEYVIEWGRAAFNFDDYGGEVTSVSADPRETFIFNGYNSILGRNPDQEGFDFYNTGGGSGLTQTQFEAQLANSPEARAISGSARVDGATTEFTIPSAVDDSMYSIRVKAINDFGTSSAWATVTVNTGKDDTSPNAPTSLTATGGYRTVRLAWTAPTANTNGSALTDLALYNIYRGTSANPTTKVASTAGEGWTDSGLADNTTYHYRVTAVDFTGNESAYSNNDSTATNATLVDGTDGNTVAVVNVYIRSATAPSTPTGGSFNFDTLALTPPSGWSTAVPAGTDPVYVAVATASITGTSGTDSALTWSTPSILAQNGDDGTTGKSVYTAIVFQRSATAPSAPSGGSFDFGTNVLTPPSGWFLDVPSGTDPIYGTRFVFSITGDTGSQTAGTWAAPFRIAEDGADGLDGNDGADGISTYQASIFRRSSSTPSTPTGGSYNFGTNTLTPPSGWSISVPSGTDPLYTSTTLASIQGVSGTDSSLTWTTPVILARDGADGAPGANGDRTYTGRVYYTQLRTTSPGLPSETSVTFNESTGQFTGGTFSATPGWRHSQPSVEITDTSILEWSCQYRVTVPGSLSFPQTSVSGANFAFTNITGAIQVTADIESDNFVSGSAGWQIQRDTGDAEFNDVTVRGQVNMVGYQSSIDTLTTIFTGNTIGGRLQTGTSGDVLSLYHDSFSRYPLLAFNNSGPAATFSAGGTSANGLTVSTTASSGSAIFAQNSGAGGGDAEIGVANANGGWGVWVPTSSNNGILSQLSSNTSGKEAGRFQNTNASGGGDAILGLPPVSGGWGVYVPTDSRQGVYAEVNGTATSRDAGWFRNSGTGGGWIILGRSDGNAGWAFDAPAGDGRLQAGTYTPFTGSHDGLLLKGTEVTEGDILCDGEVVFCSVSDSITKVSLSSGANDPSCIGVFKRKFTVFDLPLLGEDNPLADDFDHIQVNSVGEGGINVCGENGNIDKGDLIVTSSTPGKGMRQGDDIVRSYTVAKAREDVTFSGPNDIKMIACIYLCG